MKTPRSNSFKEYGILLEGDFQEIVEYLEKNSLLPEQGNIYVADDPEFGKLASSLAIKEKYFVGEMQAGYCNGQNELLNCLEYHGCPEVDIAATDLVLLLASQKDVVNKEIQTEKVVPFFLKKGEGVLLYPGTFHFSPCKQEKGGFRSAVFLSKGTNAPLKEVSLDPSYFKVNKWLFAHKEAKQASLGAYIGLKGENLKVKW
ncbi:MAG: DUF4867 family protein [Bacilli bacterium]|jgi:hypothetical protein|nr:DUF4867 family protein [Bacilli bacterium]